MILLTTLHVVQVAGDTLGVVLPSRTDVFHALICFQTFQRMIDLRGGFLARPPEGSSRFIFHPFSDFLA